MKGIANYGQKLLSDIAHVKQSICDILTTPVGSRVMRRNYGSKLFELIDQPMNQITLAKILNFTLEAIDQWESRVSVSDVKVNFKSHENIILTIDFIYLVNGHRSTIKGLRI
ncbi:GPW/gp25 family protein [Thiotrichales bacterium 19S9-12]|nr:GPW/gp25 family protein [Thiotrichales bacterium 19S9-11]MCF6812502.1 GPW/gp25 family protein [Thiotrichales bacterium 19S9-12]